MKSMCVCVFVQKEEMINDSSGLQRDMFSGVSFQGRKDAGDGVSASRGIMRIQ